MPEPFLLAKFFDFSLPTIGKIISIGLKLLIIIALLWSVYVTFIKPHTNPTPTTEQTAEEIVNHTHNYPKVMFGCVHWGAETEKRKVVK